jgi:dipeptidyl aminopeptidase/acylaminoacyl peptidase
MKPFAIEDLWRLRRVGRPSPAPDGSFAVVGITSYDLASDMKLERLYLTRPGGEERAITSEDASASTPSVSPDGRQVAFLRTPPGSEHAQVHVLPLGGGEARRVTDLPLGARDPRWLPDGRRLLVVAPLYREALTVEGTRRLVALHAKRPVRPHVTEDRVYRYWDTWLTDGKVPHVLLVEAESGGVVDLTPDSERWWNFMEGEGQYDIAPDGSEVVFAANTSRPPHARMRWAIYAVATGGGETRCLTPTNPANDLRPRYAPDGRAVLYGTQRDPVSDTDRVRVALLDRASGLSTILTEAWDRSASAWEWLDARTVAIEVEERGRVAVYTIAVDESSRAPARLPLPGSVHLSRAAGRRLFFTTESLVAAPEAACLSLTEGAVTRLTHANDEALSGFEAVGVDEIEFAGAAGDTVHGFLLYPPGFDPARTWPLLQLIHGGPLGMFGDVWHWRWNARVFAAAGYVVALVNFHGSSSYGQAWANSILGDWGGKAAEDLLLATDHLIERGFVDRARIAIAGGSFGGYMACWLTTRTNRFACAIAHAAVYQLPSLWAADVTQGAEVDLGGEPWGSPSSRAAIDRFDPASFSHECRTPMLILHGEKDYRVPVTHALQAYGILKAKGVPARLVYFPDENHFILKPRNSVEWYSEFLGWLRRFLGPGDGEPRERRRRSEEPVVEEGG